MSTEEFIIGSFVRVDDAMSEVPVHPQGLLYPSESVTLGLLYALKGVSQRAFYRWLQRDYAALLPFLPYREPVLLAIDERRRAQVQHRALAQLQALGYEVTLTPKEPAA
jgi:hypothetical protein